MASPSQPGRTYHVFLSFRGPDSRDNVVSHFHRALDEAGIYTYIDSVELQKGDRISDALPKAIEDSCIALIIFSKRYATSPWCLKEVTKIMECRKTNGLYVLPVFLNVDPKEVRGGRESYLEAFTTYENKCKDGTAVGFDLQEVGKWKEALKEAGELSGWVYDNRVITKLDNGTPIQSASNECKSEAEFVRVIVEWISERLERTPVDVDKDTVDMPSQVDKVMSILNLRSEDEVQDKSLMIGLWAMGGMGKTTLAKLIYNSIFKKFQDAAFLDIPSNSENLTSLQKQMLSKLTHTDITVTSHGGGIAFLKDRLKSKRVLIILDGVNDKCQMDNLIGKEHNYFSNGSRIIVTTRNKNVFHKRKAAIYEVKALEDHEARDLLVKCASEKGKEGISGDLVKSALKCTRCLPLALKELGSDLIKKKDEFDRDIELRKFALSSNQFIHNELEKSLNGLDDKRKGIFLDIACFFDGWSRKYVEGLLGTCYVKFCQNDRCYDDRCYHVAASTANGYVNDLIERSLITEENGTLRVHPLIKLMGQKVAGGDRLLPKRSRLWQRDEVARVLSTDKGKFDVEAVVLAPKEPEEIEKIGSNSFKKLKKLKFLIMINVNVKTSFQGPIDLPDQLRWFEWPECPASSLKISSAPLNPGVLAVRKSLLVKFPEGT